MMILSIETVFPSLYADELSSVEDAIPAAVKALEKPVMRSFPGGIQMAVSSSSEVAQEHVNQGLNHLHGGWEFEASRHFAVAMREDPDCLLAHWGMVIALLNPSPETGEARNAATDRLLALIEQGKGTELERGYAYGLVKYIEEGPSGAAKAFAKIAEKFPNDLQAGVFCALFNRGGYDDAGDATPAQVDAEKRLLALIAKHPQSPAPLHALLLIRAEGPDLTESIDLALKLCQMVPDYPPYCHLLGHYLWRCGHHREAASFFGIASSFYQRWMKEGKVTVADCPEWVKSECYRIVALVSKGDFEAGYTAACQVAATPLPAGRFSSPGARFLLWDAKTLPARILIHRGLQGNANEVSRALPKTEEIMATRKDSLAYWWIDGLRLALDAQRLMDAGKLDDARNVVTALAQHGEMMEKTQSASAESGERSAWNRAFRALEILASDVRGRLVMAGPGEMRGTAYNWFSSGADRQRPAPFLMPPFILTPMAARLGEFYLATQKPAEAVDAFERALTAFPNDMSSLIGLKKACEATGQSAELEKTVKKIESTKSERP